MATAKFVALVGSLMLVLSVGFAFAPGSTGANPIGILFGIPLVVMGNAYRL